MANKTKNPAPSTSKLGLSKATNGGDDISLLAQRQRLLARLCRPPIITTQDGCLLNVLFSAARVFELYHRDGHNIVTYLVEDRTMEGKTHSIVQYSLISDKCNSGKPQGGDRNVNS